MPTTRPTTEQVAGQELEPYVARIYSRVVGRDVVKGDGDIQFSSQHPWMLYSPEYLCLRPEGVDNHLVECKTSQSYDGWGDEGSDEVPIEYYIQAQHQMHVSGYRQVDFALLVRGTEFSAYTVEYDANFCEQMVVILRDFWYKHVLAKVPPEIDWQHPKTPELVVRLNQGLREKVAMVSNCPELIEAVAHYQFCKAQIKLFTEEKEREYARILSQVAPCQKALVGGAFEVTLSKVKRRAYSVEESEYLTMRVKELANDRVAVD